MKSVFRKISILGATALLCALAAACRKEAAYLRVSPTAIELAAGEQPQGLSVRVETSAATWMTGKGTPPPWIEYSYDQEAANVLWVTIKYPNESLEERSTELVIVAGNGLSVVVPIRQRASNPHFDVTPRVLAFDGHKAGSATLTVSTDLSEWEFSLVEASEWLTVTRGEGAGTLTVEAALSRSLDERRDTIVVRPSREAYLPLADSIAVVQSGVDLVVESGSINPLAGEIKLASESTGAEVSVRARAAWTVSCDDSSVTLSPTGGGADTNEGVRLTITLPPNTSTGSVRHSLDFVCAGHTYHYSIVQAGAAASGSSSSSLFAPKP